MTPSGSRRSSKWLFTLLFITVLLTLWTALHSEDISDADTIELEPRDTLSGYKKSTTLSAAAEPGQEIATKTQDSLIPWGKLKREPLQGKTYNLFKVHSWVVVPPVRKVKSEPPPPPVAPPAPFTYMGKLEDSPKSTLIFLTANGKLYSTRQGEKIDQQWRLDAEDANTIRLTYLPLNLPQVLLKSAKPVVSAALPSVATETNL